MRLPRVRLTVRRMMVAVVAVAVVMWAVILHRRAERFLQRVNYHAHQVDYWQDALDMNEDYAMVPDESGAAVMAHSGKRVNYHAALRRKYEYATLHPWLPLPPDPPPP